MSVAENFTVSFAAFVATRSLPSTGSAIATFGGSSDFTATCIAPVSAMPAASRYSSFNERLAVIVELIFQPAPAFSVASASPFSSVTFSSATSLLNSSPIVTTEPGMTFCSMLKSLICAFGKPV